MSFPLLDLPEAILSNILGTFSSGKTISTVLLVVQGCYGSNNNSVLGLIRNALHHRYGQLQERLPYAEISDVLMVLREDVRTSDDVSKFPEWCAILDYFESQMGHENLSKGWVVWCGPMETVFGTCQASLRCSVDCWSLGAFRYWYHEVEMNQFAIVHPHSRDIDNEQRNFTRLHHYGTIEGLQQKDQMIIQRQHTDLEENPESWQHYLVLRPKTYDELPSEFLTPKIGDNSTLFCYWDFTEYNHDWEDSLSRLGEDVIRILTRCIREKGSFP